MTNKKFKVVAKSSNMGSFGHYQYVVMAEDGESYKILISYWREIKEGDILTARIDPDGPDFGISECAPDPIQRAPEAVIKEVWG